MHRPLRFISPAIPPNVHDQLSSADTVREERRIPIKMVYLYRPYPALPDIPQRTPDGRTTLTAPGTIAVLLPSLAPVVDIAASQWAAGELPDAQRIGREWWDDREQEEIKRGRKEEAEVEVEVEVEDGEILHEPVQSPREGERENDDTPPTLTRAHYAPRVVALAKRLAARRGAKLCVDPKASKDLDSPPPPAAPKPRDPTPPPISPASPPPPKPPTPEAREATPSSLSDTPLPATHHPLGKGMRGRARGRGTGRWAGHWQAKAAAAAREAKAGQLAAARAAAAAGTGTVTGTGGGNVSGLEAEKEEGPEAERRRRREVGVALGNSSWWSVRATYRDGG